MKIGLAKAPSPGYYRAVSFPARPRGIRAGPQLSRLRRPFRKKLNEEASMKLSRWGVTGVAALLALAAPVFGQFWPQWMVNAQHTGTPGVAGQNLNRIL